MTRFARVARRPLALWIAAALVLSTVVGISAFERGAPAVAFQQAGHWVYNSALGSVFRVDGGGKNVDAEVGGVEAEPGSPVLQGSANGYVVSPGKVTVFGKSDLTVKDTLRIGIPEEPLGIEAPGGPYLVYRQHGQIVRLGDARQTVTVGSVVSSATATADGTLWVRGEGRFCRLASDATELDCSMRAPVDDHGALLQVAGEPAFANIAEGTVTRLTGDAAGREVPLGLRDSLPAEAKVAQSDVGGRIPILTGDRLLLVDAEGGERTATVQLPAGRYDALAAAGEAVAVLDTEQGVLRTFDADGRAVDTHRLSDQSDGSDDADDADGPDGSDGSDGAKGIRMTPGEDGRIYLDDDSGAVVTVVDGDGRVSDVRTDGDDGERSGDRSPNPEPTKSSTPRPDRSPDPDPDPDPDPTRTPDPEPSDPPAPQPDPEPGPGPDPGPDPDPQPDPEPKPGPTEKPDPEPPAPSPPGAPRAVSVQPGDGQATVTWDAARPNGAEVTSYRVRFRVAPGTVVIGLPESGEVDVSGDERSATFTELLNQGGYIFTVSATNKAGTGPAVETDTVRIGGQAEPPRPPTNVTAEPQPDGTVDVSWEQPSENGFPVTRYTVHGSDGSTTNVVAPGATRSLRPALGAPVSYQVTAENLNGTSPKSAASRTVRAYDQAAAPELTATGNGNGSVSVSWNQPNLSGGELVHYLVTASGRPDRKVDGTTVRYDEVSPAPITVTVKAVTREQGNPNSTTVEGMPGSVIAGPNSQGITGPGDEASVGEVPRVAGTGAVEPATELPRVAWLGAGASGLAGELPRVGWADTEVPRVAGAWAGGPAGEVPRVALPGSELPGIGLEPAALPASEPVTGIRHSGRHAGRGSRRNTGRGAGRRTGRCARTNREETRR